VPSCHVAKLGGFCKNFHKKRCSWSYSPL
jgi:hypothetical protein